MKVYFYHTQDLNMIQRQWSEGRFPGHFLYGATHLERKGIDVVWHKHKAISSRLPLMLYVTWRVLTCREHFDAIYATRFNGLELLVFLRALHLFPKPIIIWHHQPIVKADNALRELFAKIFYHGFDHLFFFSQNLIDTSLKSSKANAKRMQVAHWGADLEYYDRLRKDNPIEKAEGFISTGKEKRDMPTLLRAFSATAQRLDVYIAYNACGDNYLEIINDLRPSQNVHINFIDGLVPHDLAQKVSKAQCVAICCQETNYTVGLTTLVEALALGLPVIATRNATYPVDIEKEGIGFVVPLYDSVAWEKAIRYIANNKEEATKMGKKARALAERLYNLDNLADEVSAVLKTFDKSRGAKHSAAKPVEDVKPSRDIQQNESEGMRIDDSPVKTTFKDWEPSPTGDEPIDIIPQPVHEPTPRKPLLSDEQKEQAKELGQKAMAIGKKILKLIITLLVLLVKKTVQLVRYLIARLPSQEQWKEWFDKLRQWINDQINQR